MPVRQRFRGGFRRVKGKGQTRFGEQVHAFVGEIQHTDGGVMKLFAARTVEANVVAAPAAAEVLAARRQLADEIVHPPVVRVPPGLRAQDGHAGVSCGAPVRVEAVGVLVQERVTGEVGNPGGGSVVEAGVHRAAELIGGEQVHPAVTDDRRTAGDRVEYPLQRGVRCPSGSIATRLTKHHAGTVGCLRQVQQVGALGLVQFQGPGDGIQDRSAHPGQDTAFEFRVILHADAGQGRDLAAAKALDPARTDIGQADVAWGHLCPSGGEELADLGSIVHGNHGNARPAGEGCPVGTRHGRDFFQRGFGTEIEAAPTHPALHLARQPINGESTAMLAPTPLRMTKAVLATVILVSTIAPLATDMYVPAFPQVGSDLAGTATQVQLTLTTFFVGMALGQLIGGRCRTPGADGSRCCCP